MAKVVKLTEAQQLDKVQDLMMQVQLYSKRAEPHSKALKEIEAEIEVIRLKIKHIMEEHVPECRGAKSLNYYYIEDEQAIVIEILTEDDVIKAKMPKKMPENIKDVLCQIIKGMENL